MGARSRRKGAAWEREVATLFTTLGLDSVRELDECRDGNLGDVRLPPHVPFCVQCKVGATPPVWRAIAEARAAAKPGHTPVAIVRRNGAGRRPSEDLAVLPLATFAALLARIYGEGGNG
jgi:hypothetical protein